MCLPLFPLLQNHNTASLKLVNQCDPKDNKTRHEISQTLFHKTKNNDTIFVENNSTFRLIRLSLEKKLGTTLVSRVQDLIPPIFNLKSVPDMISPSDQTHITALFRRFGCNERETQIYLKLLSLGPSSVQELAKALRSNRVTIHSAVEQLIEKGFCYESRKGKRRLLVAEKSDILHKLWHKQQHELEVAKKNINYVESLIQKLESSELGRPNVKLYEDVEGFRNMLHETLETKGEILVISYVHLLSEIVDPEYLEGYYEKRSKKGIHTRLIFPPCPFADKTEKKKDHYKMNIRYLPAEHEWKSGIFAWDNKISLLSYTAERLTCTIIENEDIAYFFREIMFEMMWDVAKGRD